MIGGNSDIITLIIIIILTITIIIIIIIIVNALSARIHRNAIRLQTLLNIMFWTQLPWKAMCCYREVFVECQNKQLHTMMFRNPESDCRSNNEQGKISNLITTSVTEIYTQLSSIQRSSSSSQQVTLRKRQVHFQTRAGTYSSRKQMRRLIVIVKLIC